MPSSHLILCRPLFLLPPIHPSIRVFSNESTLHMRWPKYWSFSFSIIPSREIPGLISFRIDRVGSPCSPRDSQESSPTPQFKSINSSALSFLQSPTVCSLHLCHFCYLRDITLSTKVHLVKAMVFPVVMYGCENWTIKKAEHQRIDAFELWYWRRLFFFFWRRLLLRVPWTAGRSNQSILRKSVLNIHLKDWCKSWNCNTLATWCEELTHLKRPWCWERLKVGEEGDNREWDG